MLAKLFLGFLPSNVIPAATSLVAIYLFTRLTSPEEYGAYALVISVSQMCLSILFYWLQVGAVRHIDEAKREGTLLSLRSTVYRGHLATFAAFLVVYAIALAVLPLRNVAHGALWWGALIVGLRGLVATNQGFHRAELRTGRYNLVECGQALLALVFAVVFLQVFQDRAAALLAGAAAAAAAVLLIDLSAIAQAVQHRASRTQLRSLLSFGLPISASFALGYILSASDRLLVEYFLGSGPVGIYSVAYGLMDRALGSLFIAVSIAAFPLAIRAFEQDGPEGGQRQLRSNGQLLIVLAIPSCVLLMCLSRQLAGVMVGPAFREEAAAIMPWIAVAALLSGFQTHYFDHAFHLTRRTGLFLLTLGPAAALNIVANLILLPRFGLMGAVWATLIAYAAALAASVLVGRRLLKVPMPMGDLLKAAIASAAMGAAILALNPPPTLLGLIGASLLAILLYLVLAWALDVAGLRQHAAHGWNKLRTRTS